MPPSGHLQERWPSPIRATWLPIPATSRAGKGRDVTRICQQRDVAIDALPDALPDDPRPAIDDDALPLPRVGGVVKGMMMGLSISTSLRVNCAHPAPCGGRAVVFFPPAGG